MPKQTEIIHEGNAYYSVAAHRKIANLLAQEYCKNNHIKFNEVISQDRHHDIVESRAKVARYLFKIGFSSVCIGYVLKRDHTTAMYYQSPKFDYLGV
jgi:chromosomal replication initiation ATPase DnaA